MRAYLPWPSEKRVIRRNGLSRQSERTQKRAARRGATKKQVIELRRQGIRQAVGYSDTKVIWMAGSKR